MNERIRMIRKDLELSRTAFGEKLGVSGDVINNWERGRVEIKESAVKLICNIYSVNETWLRTGEGDPYGPDARTDEITAFVGEILKDDSDFRRRFISVLARMTTDEWKLLEKKVLELTEEIKKAGP